MKVLGNKDRMRCKYRRRSTLESEKNVMKLTHPNIIKVKSYKQTVVSNVLQVFLRTFKVVAFFDAPNEVDNSIIVMEFAGKQSIQSLLDEKSTLLTKKFIQRWVEKQGCLVLKFFLYVRNFLLQGSCTNLVGSCALSFKGYHSSGCEASKHFGKYQMSGCASGPSFHNY